MCWCEEEGRATQVGGRVTGKRAKPSRPADSTTKATWKERFVRSFLAVTQDRETGPRPLTAQNSHTSRAGLDLLVKTKWQQQCIYTSTYLFELGEMILQLTILNSTNTLDSLYSLKSFSLKFVDFLLTIPLL